MHTSGSVAAVDLGATSGRVIVGHVDQDGVRMDHVARFPNGPVTLHEGDDDTGRDALHWDVVELYRQVTEGLRRAFAEHPAIASVGIDSWAVDYGLLRDGRLLGLPSHYRDDRHQGGVVPVHDRMHAAELYARNGLQHLPFNTLFQWAADPSLQLAQRALLVPDLLGYWLTGVEAAERTNASTTGALNATTRGWDPAVRAAAGLPAGLLPTLRDPGDRLGPLLPSVAEARRRAGRRDAGRLARHGERRRRGPRDGAGLRLHLVGHVVARRRRGSTRPSCRTRRDARTARTRAVSTVASGS